MIGQVKHGGASPAAEADDFAALLRAIREAVPIADPRLLSLLDSLRRDARTAGYDTLAMVASACEQAMAGAGGRLSPAAAGCWCAAIEDALVLECDMRTIQAPWGGPSPGRGAHAAGEALVASVAVRLRA